MSCVVAYAYTKSSAHRNLVNMFVN